MAKNNRIVPKPQAFESTNYLGDNEICTIHVGSGLITCLWKTSQVGDETESTKVNLHSDPAT